MKKFKTILIFLSFLFCSSVALATQNKEQRLKTTLNETKTIFKTKDIDGIKDILTKKTLFLTEQTKQQTNSLTCLKNEETLETKEINFEDFIKSCEQEIQSSNEMKDEIKIDKIFIKQENNKLKCFDFTLIYDDDSKSIKKVYLNENKFLTNKIKIKNKLEKLKYDDIEKFLKNNNFVNKSNSIEKLNEEDLTIKEINLLKLKNLIYKKLRNFLSKESNQNSQTILKLNLVKNNENKDKNRRKKSEKMSRFKL